MQFMTVSSHIFVPTQNKLQQEVRTLLKHFDQIAAQDNQEVLDLWPGSPPDGPGPRGDEQVSSNWSLD